MTKQISFYNRPIVQFKSEHLRFGPIRKKRNYRTRAIEYEFSVTADDKAPIGSKGTDYVYIANDTKEVAEYQYRNFKKILADPAHIVIEWSDIRVSPESVPEEVTPEVTVADFADESLDVLDFEDETDAPQAFDDEGNFQGSNTSKKEWDSGLDY